MWNYEERPKTVRASKALVAEFCNMTPAPRDRPLNERKLAAYHRILSQGSFRPVTWASAKCKETGETYRVNGKHTSLMLSEHESIPEFYINLERYSCDTLEGVANLYSTFDTRESSRNTSDINASFAGTIPELADVPSRIVNLSVTAIAYNKWLNGYTLQPATERAALLLDNVPFVMWLHEILSASPKPKHLLRGAVCAAMCGSFEKSRKDASEFWTAVRDETGPAPSTSDRRLNKFLCMHAVALGKGGASTGNRKATAKEFYVKCIHAWNAWRRGETTDLKYFAAAKIPSFR